MPPLRVDEPTVTPEPARVTWSSGSVRLCDAGVLGPGNDRACERFLGRVFATPGVRSVDVDRGRATATVRHDPDPPREPGAFLRRLAAAVRGHDPATTPRLPAVTPGPVYTLHRHGALVSFWEVVSDRPGRLVLRHAALRNDRRLGLRVERLLEAVPGVLRASWGSRTGTMRVGYDPSALAVPRLVRLAEKALAGPDAWSRALPDPEPVRFATANLTLGVAAAGEFVLPALAPVSAVLLVGTNLKTFRTAWRQVRGGRVGLPVLYTAIVGTSLATGQFLGSALMTWLFAYWHDRHRNDLAAERHRLLDACVPRPALARVPAADGREVFVESDRLRPGDLIVVGAGEAVPADGRVARGDGAVDERGLRGREGASRRGPGDAVSAGSVVLAGELHVAVERAGEGTRAAAIGRALIGATSPDPGLAAPTRHAEAIASRAGGPPRPTPRDGGRRGGPSPGGAILRPDYATGPALAVPLETIRDVADCARHGLLVRDPAAFHRLVGANLIVLDDDPALRRSNPEVAEATAERLPEVELLRYAASTFRHLDDARAAALDDACRARKIHLLDLEPVDLRDGVAVREGRHVVRVREAEPGSGPCGALAVEVDGAPVGRVSFRRSSRPGAAGVVRRLRGLTAAHVALVSERPRAEAAPLGAALGVNQVVAGLTPEAKAAFIRGCRERGVKAVFVGDGRRNAAAAGEADVAIDLADDNARDLGTAPVVLLGGGLRGLDALWDVARSHAQRVRAGHAFVLVPNVACVAGAFLFGFTGLTAVVVSNLGTFGAYNRAAGSLRTLDRGRRPTPGRWHQSRN